MEKFNMTVGDVANILHVSKATVRLYIKTGELKAIVIGRHFYRISPTSLEQFQKHHATKIKERAYE